MTETRAPYHAQPRESEKALQESIVQVYRMHGWLVLEYGRPGGHGALRGALAPGHPDFVALKGGYVEWVEVKTPVGRLTPAQIQMHEALRWAMQTVRVLRSVDEAMSAVREG